MFGQQKRVVHIGLVIILSVAIFIWWVRYIFFPMVNLPDERQVIPKSFQETSQEFKDILEQGREYLSSSTTKDSLQEIKDYYNSTSSTSTEQEIKLMPAPDKYFKK